MDGLWLVDLCICGLREDQGLVMEYPINEESYMLSLSCLLRTGQKYEVIK
jgi:hypothetical protein